MKKIRKHAGKIVGLVAYALVLTHCPILRAAGCAREVAVAGEIEEGAPVEGAAFRAFTGGVRNQVNPGAEEELRRITGEAAEAEPGRIDRPRRAREEGDEPDRLLPAESAEPARRVSRSRYERTDLAPISAETTAERVDLLRRELPTIPRERPDWADLFTVEEWNEFYNDIQTTITRILPNQDLREYLVRNCPDLPEFLERRTYIAGRVRLYPEAAASLNDTLDLPAAHAARELHNWVFMIFHEY